jgi:hypothetical protein
LAFSPEQFLSFWATPPLIRTARYRVVSDLF